LAAAKAELTDTNHELALVRQKNQRAYEENLYAKSQELKTLTGKVEAAQTRLDTLTAEANTADAKYQQIGDSLNSLRTTSWKH
jgi:uncharacterized protein (DUF3084 family)